MTVSSETNKSGPYTGNGVTVIFDYGFQISDENHVRALLTDADGVESQLEIDTDYIVSDVGNPSGGQVATVFPVPAGHLLTLLLDVPFTQETDLENQGAYYAETIERSLDLAAQRDLQLKEMVDRSVKIPASTDASALDTLIADVVRLADSIDSIDTVAGVAADVTTVAGIAANVTTVAGVAADVTTVAGIAANVTTVAGVAADVTTVAENVADITNFADVYLGPRAADPTTRTDGSALLEGDLYFNTVTKKLNVYDGADWSAPEDLALADDSVVNSKVAPNAAIAATKLAYAPAGTHLAATTVQAAITELATMFPTKAAAAAASIPAAVIAFRIAGHTTAGDGGEALYVRVGAQPTHLGKLQSADGTWWELRTKVARPEMFGAFPDVAGNQAAGIQAALDYPLCRKIELSGMFNVDTALTITRSLALVGYGNNFRADLAGYFGLKSNSLIDILTIQGALASNILLKDFTVHGDGARAGQNVRGIVVGAGGTSSTGGMTATFATFTHATAIFTAADVGKNIRVSGAGAGGSDLLTTIASINGAAPSTSVQLSIPASTTVSGAATYWVFLPENIRLEGVSTGPLHRYGVDVENCNNLYITGHGELCGEYAPVRLQNFYHSDGGDHTVSDMQFYGGSVANFHHLSGGGLKLENCKFLGGDKGYYGEWNRGVSANLLISNCSLEDQTGAAIQFKSSLRFERIGIVNNTGIFGRFIYFEDSGTGAVASEVVIKGNSGQARTSSPLIYLGSCANFICSENILNGRGVANYGIMTSGNASTGLILDNLIFSTTTGPVSNSGTGITVR